MSETHEGLSEREKEILRLVATGASNKEIARQLTISTNTVKVHLRNIFSKIGVNSRTEAAMYAVKRDLLSLPPSTRSVETLRVSAEEVFSNPQGTLQYLIKRFSVTNNSRLWLIAFIVFVSIVTLSIVAYFNGVLRSGQLIEISPTIEPNRLTELIPMSMARSGFATAVLDEQIFLFGGLSNQGVLGNVEQYDPGKNKWNTLQSKPIPVQDVHAVAISRKIFVPGGLLADSSVTSTLEIYEPDKQLWTKGTPLPMPLSAYSAVAFEGVMYLFGGWDGKKVVNNVYKYDPNLDAWSVKTHLPTARAYSGAAVSGGKIHVIGGFDNKKPLTTNEIYTPSLDDGIQDPWIMGVPLPSARYASGVTSLADILFVVGGIGSGNSTFSSFMLPPESKTWMVVVNPISLSWNRMGIVPLHNKLYLMGGNLDGKFSTRNLSYQAIFSVMLPNVP